MSAKNGTLRGSIQVLHSMPLSSRWGTGARKVLCPPMPHNRHRPAPPPSTNNSTQRVSCERWGGA